MANTITKLTTNGNYYISSTGSGLDEISGTYSTNGLICHWPTYSSSFIASPQWIDIVNGNNLYSPTSNIYNPSNSTVYSYPVYSTNNLFFGAGSTAYTPNIGQLIGATSCTVEGVIKIQSFSGTTMVLGFDHYDIFITGGALGYNTGNGDNYGITSTQITNLSLAGKYVHYVFVFTTFPSGTGTYANNQIWINGVQQTLTQNQGLPATSGRGFNNGSGITIPGSQFPINYGFTINTWPTTFASYSAGNNGFGGLKMYNRTLTPAEIVQNYNVAASNPAFGLTPISTAPQSTLRINTTTQNSATFLVNGIDEVTYNSNQTNYRKNIVNYSATPNITTGATSPYYNWVGTFANTSVTLTSATTAPDGTYTAYKFVSGLSVNPQYVFWQQNFIGQPGQTFTFSMYVKAAEYNYLVFSIYDTSSLSYYFNLTTGAVSGAAGGITYGSTYVGNGWWRIWITRTFQNILKNGQIFFNFNPAGSQYYAGDGASGGYFWGPQVELASLPTIYEPTGLNAIPLPTAISKLDSNGNSYLTGSYDEVTRGFNIVQNGLIYYMDPAKPESWNGNTTIYDLTGTNPPGSLIGGYTYSTSGGGSIRFDASGKAGTGTGYANTNVTANNTYFQPLSNFTLSIWARFDKSTTTGANTAGNVPVSGCLFGAVNFSGIGLVWTTDLTGNLLTPSQTQRAYAGISAFQETNTPTTSQNFTNGYNTINLYQWYNFVMIQTPTNINLYVNGSLSQTSADNIPGYFSGIPNSITIGSANLAGGPESSSQGQIQTFPGSIGQALIYNRALSAAEVSQNFQEMRSQYGV